MSVAIDICNHGKIGISECHNSRLNTNVPGYHLSIAKSIYTVALRDIPQLPEHSSGS